jgi:L-lactate dehydrogenase complex protein LldG
MSARAAILDAVRLTLAKRGPPPDAAAIAAEAAALLARAPATRPDRVRGKPADEFFARVISPGVAATAERIAALADVPDAVRRYLTEHGIAPAVAVQPHPALLALDWSGIATHETLAVDEPAAVGLALGGIAETGSLVFHSAPMAPTLFAFLPLHHIVAVAADRIWPWLEDYAEAASRMARPRNINLVTGASGTTDIEGALVRGAHGPGNLHILLYDAPP